MARTSGPRGRNNSQLLGALVSSPQRRAVVLHLTDNGGTAGFDDLVDVLASDAERTMTAVRLHHVHLPKLRTSGAIEWDDDTGVVRLTPQAREAVDDVARNELFDRLVSD
jgi:hypothetical protein